MCNTSKTPSPLCLLRSQTVQSKSRLLHNLEDQVEMCCGKSLSYNHKQMHENVFFVFTRRYCFSVCASDAGSWWSALCASLCFLLPLSDRCAKSSQIKTVSSSNIFFKGSRFRYRWDTIQGSLCKSGDIFKDNKMTDRSLTVKGK